MKNIKTFFLMLKQLMFILNKKQKKQFVLLIFSSIIVAMLETLGISVIIPFILVMLSPDEFMQNPYVKMLIDSLGVTEYLQVLLIVAFGIIIVYILKATVVLLISYFQAKFRNTLERDLSNKMLDSYLRQEYLFHINTNSSEVVRSVHSDISGVASVVENFSYLASEGLTAVLIGIFLICINPIMAIILLVISGVTSLGIVVGFKKKNNISGEKCRNAFQKKIQYIQQSENGIKDIIVKQKYDYFISQFKKYSQQACHYNTVYLTISKVPSKIVEIVFISGLLLTSIFCIGRGGDASLYVTQLGTFAVAAVRILPSISSLAVYLNGLIYFRPTVEATYHSLLSGVGSYSTTLPKEQKMVSECSNDTSKFKSHIEVENVSWQYSKNLDYVLEDVSLNIQKGEAIALIGLSGAGKTTLADILLGLLKPQQGSVTVDGKDVFENPEMWSEMVGYVPQSLFLLDDTVRNNIAFGVPEDEIDDERIQLVLEEAQLKDMVEKLPDGLDTNLGEQGLKISGGQRQRIAIARALYFDPEILILDEATSALDTDTETAVMESVEALHGKKTLIIVAHRLSTISKCDKIYEVANKKAVLRNKEEVLRER